MSRADRILILLLLVFVAALLAIAAANSGPSQPDRAALAAPASSGVSQISVVGAILRGAEDGGETLAYLPGYAPTATATVEISDPEPYWPGTDTAVALTASSTPTPSLTPTASPPATRTLAYQPTLTPTVEVAGPEPYWPGTATAQALTAQAPATRTPLPSQTPTPFIEEPTPEVFRTCRVVLQPAASPGLNVRVWPEVPTDGVDNYARTVDGGRIKLEPGRVVEIMAIFEDDRMPSQVDIWALAVEGWFALRYKGYEFALEAPDSPNPCSVLPRKTFDRALGGYHGISVSVQAGPVAAEYARLDDRVAIYKEAVFAGGGGAARAVRTANPHVKGIARRGAPDCPADWGSGDPLVRAQDWYAGLRSFFAANADWVTWYEYINECGHWVDWRWQVDFMWSFVRLAHADGYCTLSGSWYGAAPEPWQWAHPYLENFMQWLLEHPCANGERHGWAMHLYHEAGTGWWYHGRIPLLLMNMQPIYQLLPIHVTELGVIGQATADDAVDYGRLAAHNKAQIDGLRMIWSIDSFAVWNVGCCVGWLDLTPEMARWRAVF